MATARVAFALETVADNGFSISAVVKQNVTPFFSGSDGPSISPDSAASLLQDANSNTAERIGNVFLKIFITVFFIYTSFILCSY